MTSKNININSQSVIKSAPEIVNKVRSDSEAPQAVEMVGEAVPDSEEAEVPTESETVQEKAGDEKATPKESKVAQEKTAAEEQTQEKTDDSNTSPNDGQVLILKVTSKGYVLSYAVAAYDLGDHLYISLFDISDALMFPIEVHEEQKRAKGWFIEKSNDFFLDVGANQLIIAGREVSIAPDDIIVNEEGLFVNTNTLKTWFGVESSLNYSLMKLDIAANDRLNFEEQIERQARWDEQAKRKVRIRKSYPSIDAPYALAEHPSLTFQLGSTYTSAAGQTTLNESYSVQGVGDLLYMSSDYFASGSDTNVLSDARIRLYRYSEDGNALPAIGATQVEIGDITPPSLNIVGGGGNERGFYVSNRDANSVNAPDNLLIDGEVEPGWEVELYRNAEFIAFRDGTTTRTGRYEFTGLSLDAGSNIFKIIKYGPHGEKETEYRSFLLGDGMLKAGKWNYDLSLSQPLQQMIPIPDKDFDFGATPRLIAGTEYGLLDTLSLGTGLYSGPLFNKDRHGATVSVRNSLWGVYSRADHLQNMDNSSISAVSQKTNIGDFNLSGFTIYYNGFDVQDQDQELGVNGSIGTSLDVFGTSVSLRAGGQLDTYQTGRVVTTYDNQISTSILGYSFSNQLQWEFDKIGNTINETMSGELFFRDYFKDIFTDSGYGILFRANLDYQVKPLSELENVDIAAEKNINEKIRLGLDYTQNLRDTENWAVGGKLSYDHDYFITDFSAQYNNEGDYTLGANMRFNIGYDHAEENYGFVKMRDAGRGTVTAFAYHDKNYNSVFDGDDLVLKDVEFKSDNGNSGTSNEKGLATINGETGFRKTNLLLQAYSLPDIFLVPAKEGVQYVPRPGHLSHFEFPVVLGGEVDGMVKSLDPTLEETFDFSEIQIELVDMSGKIMKSIEADPTGYFLFEQVIPDNYHVRVVADSVKGMQLTEQSVTSISVPKQDPVVNDLSLTVILPAVVDASDVYGPTEPVTVPSPLEAPPAAATEIPTFEGKMTPIPAEVAKDSIEKPQIESVKADSAAQPETNGNYRINDKEEFIAPPNEKPRYATPAPVLPVDNRIE